MISTKKDLDEYIEYETRDFKHRALLKVPFDLYESQIIAKFLVLLRKTEYHINCKHKIRKLAYMLMLKRKQCKYGIHIPVNVFDKGLSIGHLGTIVVNGNAVIGKNCRIHVGVVVGANGENVRGGDVPVIGDNVYLGPGTKIFGGIYIADGCKIGANAVVNKSCKEKNGILVGIPAKNHCSGQ